MSKSQTVAAPGEHPILELPLDPTDVDYALPDGLVYQLPDEWLKTLQAKTTRSESPSSIRSYLGCPLRWYLERYSAIEADDEAPSVYSVIGTFVHRILEMFYSEPAELRSEELLNRTFRTAWDALKQQAETGIIPTDLQRDFDRMIEASDNEDQTRGMFYKRSKECIEGVLEFDQDPSQVNVIATETMVRVNWNGTMIRGKIDRLRATRTGASILIDDYKTGRAPDPDEEVSVLSDSFVPMGLYALMLIMGDTKDTLAGAVRSVNLLYLKPNGNEYSKYTIRITDEVIEEVKELLDKALGQMEYTATTGNIIVSPANTPSVDQCGFCPASGICPAWTDGTFDKIKETWGI